MKSFTVISVIVLIILTSLSGCEKSYVVSKSQDILFQFEYINHAWGYAHSGFLIDVNGNILLYDLPEKWNFPTDDQILTQKEVIENIGICQIAGIKILPDELRKYTNYIDNIAASKVTSPKNVAADAGTIAFYCYQYSESSLTYKRTVIKTEGDFLSENLNFYSKKIVEWMNNIKSLTPVN
jgi:hypothetical protein